MNIEKNSIKDFNYGLAILRIWMCFEVVLVHFKKWSVTQGANFSLPQRILILYEWIAVPVFMLTSFIFTDMNKLSKDNDKIKHRLYRLLIPHFFWAFVYYAIYRILDNIKGLDLEHGIIDLYWQLLLGHSINQTEWFQIDLIVLTLLFIVIFRFCPKSIAIKLTFCIGCLAFYFQYSGKNGAMFDKIVWPEGFQTDYVTYPVGRLCEMVPYAVLGIMLCNYYVFDLVKRYWKYIVIATLLFLSLLFNYQLFPVVERQYGYSGLRYFVIGTMSVFLFYFLPLHWLPKIIKSIIKFLAKYTMAVYFMHRLVATILYNSQLSFWLRLRPGSFYDCMVIYFCCVVTAWLISLIPIKLISNSVM